MEVYEFTLPSLLKKNYNIFISIDGRRYVPKGKDLKFWGFMSKLKRLLFFSLLVVGTILNLLIIQGNASLNSSNQEQNLADILKKSSEYCDRLAQSSLFFVCEEKIEERIFGYTYFSYWGKYRYSSSDFNKIEKNTYLYDYQLIKKGNKIEESRILLEENGKKKNEKNAELKTKRFYSKRPIFGPIGLLSKESQELYEYKILKEDTLEGRKVFILETKPKTKMKNRPSYGKIWIDQEDSSILKIETEEESLMGFETLRKEMEKQGIIPTLKATHFYYTMEKNLRFPSSTVFEEAYSGAKLKGKRKKSITNFVYDNYRFFTVEVEVR